MIIHDYCGVTVSYNVYTNQVNVFFLLAALRSVYKQRRSKMKDTKGSKKNIALFK